MSRLSEPLTIGSSQLKHRLTMAPLTRLRCDDAWAPTPMVAEYYQQRAAVPGTLLITEATLISYRAVGGRNVPGIWSDAQVKAWKQVTDAVHAKGCPIYCQLWHQGRAGMVETLHAEGSKLESSSAVPIDDNSATPVAMSEEDIQQTIRDYVTAAKNAMAAGFDGVEIHGANGYLLDQFLQDTCNKRTDRWGGSTENRARMHLEVVKAVSQAVGADRTALRLSPYSTFQGMLMDEPEPTFRYLLDQLKPVGLAYLHLVEARISGNVDVDQGQQSVKWMVEQWNNACPVLLAGGFTPDSAKEAVDELYEGYDVAIVFGRYFIRNPDLVFRILSGVALDKYDRDTFYIPKSPKGYIDYPYSAEFVEATKA